VKPSRRLGRSAALASLLLLAGAAAGRAGGFAADQEGVKAMGMAGAFTAVADDPSCLYYNVGGMSLLKKGTIVLGASALYLQQSLYQGLPPGIGTGTTGEQAKVKEIPAHAYLILPFGTRAKVGFGVEQPFGLKTEWSEPLAFPGRFISLTSQIRSYDLNPSFSFAVTPDLGVGVGAIYRLSDLSNTRHLATADPATGQPLDVASLDAGTDFDGGGGWNVGILHRPSPAFSWGFSYRSAIKIDYKGSARLTQILTGNSSIDALTTASLPLNSNLPIASTIEFPSTATLGLAVNWGYQGQVTTAFDISRTEWNRFTGLGIGFVNNPSLSYTLQGAYKDALSYRLGLRWKRPGGAQWRLGVAYDPTPQPDASVSPFLPDANRTTLALGWGLDWLDVALQWVQWSDRTTLSNADTLNGTYRTRAFVLGVSVNH
jgi:long-chain fatty acid transport protein